jgi:hypothetical protein
MTTARVGLMEFSVVKVSVSGPAASRVFIQSR